MSIYSRRLPLVALICLLLSEETRAQLFFDAETGVVFAGAYNNIRQPAEGGTQYNAFGPDFTVKPILNLRGRLGYTFGNRHTVFATYAPLLIESVSTGTLIQPVRFEDLIIAAGQRLTTRYKFNGYRLTYRYSLVRNEKFRLAMGATANIRDAYIEAGNGTESRRFSDLGIVPLLSLYATYQPGRLGLLLDGDGLASPFGRVADVFAGATYAIRPRTKLRLGYRIVEGGGNTNNFYNFARFDVAVVGLQVGLY